MRLLVAFLCATLCVGAVVATESVNVTIVEIGRITNYLDAYWVVNVDGNITIVNPTDRDLYDVELRYDIGSLELVEGEDTSYFQGGQMVISRIPANDSITAAYNIVGISLSNPALDGKGVLYTAMAALSPVIYTDTFGSLQKASLENETLTGRPGRLISLELTNPTGFQFTVNSMKIVKTSDLDPNNILDEWAIVNATDPITISPDQFYVRDILDLDSAEGEVYWLVADVYISRVEFTDESNVTRFFVENLTLPPELLNYTINLTNLSGRDPNSFTELYIKKVVSKQVVTLDSPVEITVLVNNFAEELIDFTITEELPPGFRFQAGEGWTESGNTLLYKGTVSGKNVAVPEYTATLVDASSAGLDYFPASIVEYTVDGSGKTVYSERVPFIRQYLPNQKIFVQKRLAYQGDSEVLVTITVQNLGSTSVKDLLLKDYLEDTDVFSQISQQPSEKGLWAIPELKANEQWEVSYLTTEDTKLTLLPGLFGVASSDVLRSLVLEAVVSTGWEAAKKAAIEVVGIGLLIGLPVLYFFLRKKNPPILAGGAPPQVPPANPPI